MVIHDCYVGSLRPERIACVLSQVTCLYWQTPLWGNLCLMCSYHDSRTLGEFPVRGKFSLCVSQSSHKREFKMDRDNRRELHYKFYKGSKNGWASEKIQKPVCSKKPAVKTYFGDQFSSICDFPIWLVSFLFFLPFFSYFFLFSR